LFLINHWVSTSPPDSGVGQAANARAVLEKRVDQCLKERGIAPTVIAADFAESGDLVSTVNAINERKLKEERSKRLAEPPPTAPPAETPPQGDAATPPPEPTGVARLPEPTLITTLTGGDPARFCRALPAANLVLTPWALAIVDSSLVDSGLTDYAYGPLLARDIKPLADASPQEIAPRLAPIVERARASVASLRALGLSTRDIKKLADAASDALLSPQKPDGLQVRADIVKRLEKKVDPERLRQAAEQFRTGQADPVTLLDIGNVPPEVGVAAGYPCAAAP
jgi:hypothetical protein